MTYHVGKWPLFKVGKLQALVVLWPYEFLVCLFGSHLDRGTCLGMVKLGFMALGLILRGSFLIYGDKCDSVICSRPCY